MRATTETSEVDDVARALWLMPDDDDKAELIKRLCIAFVLNVPQFNQYAFIVSCYWRVAP